MGLAGNIANTHRAQLAANLIVWSGQKSLELKPCFVGDEALRIQHKIACPAVSQITAAVAQGKESITVDRQIEGVFCHFDSALAESDRGTRDSNTCFWSGSGPQQRLLYDAGKVGAGLLEGDSAGIGNVVTDHIEIEAGGANAGYDCFKRHGKVLLV